MSAQDGMHSTADRMRERAEKAERERDEARADMARLVEMTKCEEPFALVLEARREMEERERERDEARAEVTRLRTALAAVTDEICDLYVKLSDDALMAVATDADREDVAASKRMIEKILAEHETPAHGPGDDWAPT